MDPIVRPIERPIERLIERFLKASIRAAKSAAPAACVGELFVMLCYVMLFCAAVRCGAFSKRMAGTISRLDLGLLAHFHNNHLHQIFILFLMCVFL